MRITIAAYLLLVPQLLAARTNDGRDSAAVALPACAQECKDRIVAQYQCILGESCYCDGNGPLQEALSTCVQESCAGLGAASALNATVQTQRLRAVICEVPNRDRSSLVLGISFTLFGLATLCFCAKTASRFAGNSRRRVGVDDTAVVLIYILLVPLTVSTYYAQRYGLGMEVWDVVADNVGLSLKWSFISRILYYGIAFGAKVAMVLLYRRTWPGHDKHWFVLCCRCIILPLIGIGIAAIFTTISACSPINLGWLTTFKQGDCVVDREAAFYTFGGINTFLNLAVFLLPVPKLLRHKSAGTQMMGVLAAYLFGLVALACSIGRLTAIANESSWRNPTWDSVPIILWSLVECNASVICCCIPALGFWHQRWRSNESSFCGVRLTGDDYPRWSLRWSSVQDQEAPFPNITPLRPTHSRQVSQAGFRFLKAPSPLWDEKSWCPSGETEVEKGALPTPAKPREHQMEAMVKTSSEITFPRRAYAPPARTPEPRTPKANPMGYYFDGRSYVGLQLNSKTPPTGPVTPVLFKIDEENVHSQLRSSSLDRGP